MGNGQVSEIAAVKERIAQARLHAEEAATTQFRQYFEGMADYWEEVLHELEHPPRDP